MLSGAWGNAQDLFFVCVGGRGVKGEVVHLPFFLLLSELDFARSWMEEDEKLSPDPIPLVFFHFALKRLCTDGGLN